MVHMLLDFKRLQLDLLLACCARAEVAMELTELGWWAMDGGSAGASERAGCCAQEREAPEEEDEMGDRRTTAASDACGGMVCRGC